MALIRSKQDYLRKILTWVDWLLEFSLGYLIFTLAISKSMVEISFACIFVLWVAEKIILHKLNTPISENLGSLYEKSNLPIAAFVGVGFLSMITSTSFSLSLEGFFCKLSECVLVYLIVVDFINSRWKAKRLLMIMLCSMLLIGINGLFQSINGIDFLRQRPTTITSLGSTISSSFGNANGFAGWLLVMVPISFSFAYFFNPNYKNLLLNRGIKLSLWILTGLLMVCLVLTYSRGAWISIIVSMIILAFVKSKKLLVILILALLILPFTVPDSIKIRANSLMNISERGMQRFTLWEEALDIVEDFPLLGSGLNTYAAVAPAYKKSETTGFYPHNSYLHMAAESGLLGLGTFLWVIISLFKTSIIRFKRIGEGFYGIYLAGLLTGLFGLLLHSFVDTDIYTLQLGVLMWFIMGLIVAIRRINEKENRDAED